MATQQILLLLCIFALANAAPTAQAPKVQLGLYYESLCPDCQEFILTQLYPTFTKVGNIMNITLVPYGNAVEHEAGGKWKFECQHGPQECTGNIIETCAIKILVSINRYLPYVHCIEENILDISRHGARGQIKLDEMKNPRSVALECANRLGIDYAPIDQCQAGELGNKLEHEMAAKTDALDPPHMYTPWVTLNGLHTEKVQNKAEANLLKLICNTYTGAKPDACRARLGAQEKGKNKLTRCEKAHSDIV